MPPVDVGKAYSTQSLLAFFALAFASSTIIPVMVQPDGSNLRPFQIIVSILVLTAIALLYQGVRATVKNPLGAPCPTH